MIKTGSDFSGVGAFDQALKKIGIDYAPSLSLGTSLNLHFEAILERLRYFLDIWQRLYWP